MTFCSCQSLRVGNVMIWFRQNFHITSNFQFCNVWQIFLGKFINYTQFHRNIQQLEAILSWFFKCSTKKQIPFQFIWKFENSKNVHWNSKKLFINFLLLFLLFFQVSDPTELILHDTSQLTVSNECQAFLLSYIYSLQAEDEICMEKWDNAKKKKNLRTRSRILYANINSIHNPIKRNIKLVVSNENKWSHPFLWICINVRGECQCQHTFFFLFPFQSWWKLYEKENNNVT